MKLQKLADDVNDILKKNPNAGNLDILIDTEARCFDCHMVELKAVYEEEFPEPFINLQIENIGNFRPNRDEHIDLVKMCVGILNLSVNEKIDADLKKLKVSADEILEYYRRQLESEEKNNE